MRKSLLNGSMCRDSRYADTLRMSSIAAARLPTENAKANEYRKQAQITELNALNAVLAVIRFKQHFKLLERLDEATCSIFDTATLEVDK